MMVFEMREAAREKAFDLLDETKDLDRQRKMVLCELEDALYECFEDLKEEDEEESREETDEGTDLGFKDKYSHRYAMRNFDKDEDMDRQMHSYRRRAMRMRRNKMGRYV